MTVLTILQARTTSSRLPGKALLPIHGYPSAALAALRASFQGPASIIATSEDTSDNGLTTELQSRGISVFRGPLQDVLKRYCLAAKDLADDAVVIRLTADNVVPDGGFVSELVESFQQSGLDYLGGPSPLNHLPYGLGGEIFRVGLLRRAEMVATSGYDREHVTPWIRRNGRCGIFIPKRLGTRDFGHLRCTIDDREDYDRMVKLFANVENPIEADWYKLMLRLAEMPGEPKFRIPYRVIRDQIHSAMTLGTAQLGMRYGIANRTGQPSGEVATRIVRNAIAHGVTAIDTARAYGASEGVVGEALTGAWASRTQVVTKLDPLEGLDEEASEAAVRAAVTESLKASMEKLRLGTLPVLLLHRWEHRRKWHGAAWRQLLEFRDAGMIGSLGASVYEPSEALEAIRDRDITHLQVPFNILDYRWQNAEFPEKAQARPEVVIHARSALLQGVLASAASDWPCADIFDATKTVRTLSDLAGELGRADIIDLCFAYVRAQQWITSVVVGCETEAQLETNLQNFCTPALTKAQCEKAEGALGEVPERLLNPSKWRC